MNKTSWLESLDQTQINNFAIRHQALISENTISSYNEAHELVEYLYSIADEDSRIKFAIAIGTIAAFRNATA